MHLTHVTLEPESYPTREFYPFSLPLFQETREVPFTSPVTFLVGENGTGKSTLLRAIARRCGIHLWCETEGRRFERNPFRRQLVNHIRAHWADGSVPGSFFGSDVFQNFAELVDEWASADPGQLDYLGGKSLLSLSHGQSLMSFFRARYALRGLYLLDEPETALSPRTQLELCELLGESADRGDAQFLVATHSPIIMSCPDSTIYSFDHAPIREIAFEDTDHWRVYREFVQGR